MCPRIHRPRTARRGGGKLTGSGVAAFLTTKAFAPCRTSSCPSLHQALKLTQPEPLPCLPPPPSHALPAGSPVRLAPAQRQCCATPSTRSRSRCVRACMRVHACLCACVGACVLACGRAGRTCRSLAHAHTAGLGPGWAARPPCIPAACWPGLPAAGAGAEVGDSQGVLLEGRMAGGAGAEAAAHVFRSHARTNRMHHPQSLTQNIRSLLMRSGTAGWIPTRPCRLARGVPHGH